MNADKRGFFLAELMGAGICWECFRGIGVSRVVVAVLERGASFNPAWLDVEVRWGLGKASGCEGDQRTTQ